MNTNTQSFLNHRPAITSRLRSVSRIYGNDLSTSFFRYDNSADDFREMLFYIIQQLDHHLANVLIEVVMFQGGEGQETRARHHVDTA